MTKQQNGKGGNFTSGKNPFQIGADRKGSRPSLGDQQRFSLALDRCIEHGCAIMVGSTRDNGALVITVLDGNDRHRTYCSNSEELESAIMALEQMYD